MPKINALGAGIALFLVALGSASAQAPAKPTSEVRTDNVNTVNALLKIENAKAIELSRKDALALGLAASTDPAGKKAAGTVAPPASLFVDAIFGVADDLRANLLYSGTRYEQLRIGAHIGPCEITSIKGRRVTLAPAGKKVSANQCPSGDWTGGPSPSELTAASGSAAALPIPSVPMPMPMSMPLPTGGLMNSTQAAAAPVRAPIPPTSR